MATPTLRLPQCRHHPAHAPDWASSRHVYRPRRPTATPLYPVVQHHLETFLAQATESDPMGYGVPSWVENDLRAYLRCGILAHGFARVRCEDCGHERLLAPEAETPDSEHPGPSPDLRPPVEARYVPARPTNPACGDPPPHGRWVAGPCCGHLDPPVSTSHVPFHHPGAFPPRSATAIDPTPTSPHSASHPTPLPTATPSSRGRFKCLSIPRLPIRRVAQIRSLSS